MSGPCSSASGHASSSSRLGLATWREGEAESTVGLAPARQCHLGTLRFLHGLLCRLHYSAERKAIESQGVGEEWSGERAAHRVMETEPERPRFSKQNRTRFR
jgi:hypothetical protein